MTARTSSAKSPPERGLHQVARTWSPWDLVPRGGKAILRNAWQRLGFSREFASLFRYEMDMLLLRVSTGLNPAHRARMRRLRQRTRLLVHLGCGNTLKPGWVNVDCYPPAAQQGCEIVVTDMNQGLPFSDGSVSAIFSEHHLEHVPFDVARNGLLPECFRVLEPGGWVRMGVPDGELWIEAYGKRTGPVMGPEQEPQTEMMRINDIARGCLHRYLYDYETLEMLFREAGFTGVRRSRANDSPVPHFRNIDQTDAWRVAHTVYCEGQRPPLVSCP